MTHTHVLSDNTVRNVINEGLAAVELAVTIPVIAIYDPGMASALGYNAGATYFQVASKILVYTAVPAVSFSVREQLLNENTINYSESEFGKYFAYASSGIVKYCGRDLLLKGTGAEILKKATVGAVNNMAYYAANVVDSNMSNNYNISMTMQISPAVIEGSESLLTSTNFGTTDFVAGAYIGALITFNYEYLVDPIFDYAGEYIHYVADTVAYPINNMMNYFSGEDSTQIDNKEL